MRDVSVSERILSSAYNVLDAELDDARHYNAIGSLSALVAMTWLGTTEVDRGNRGPGVDYFHEHIGYSTGHQWCSIFVHSVWRQAAEMFSSITGERFIVVNPKSKGAVKGMHESFAKGFGVSVEEAVKRHPEKGWQYVRVRDKKDTKRVLGGSVAKGHTGIVVGLTRDSDGGSRLLTIEGNTIPMKGSGDSANGGGVFLRSIRMDDERIVGYVVPTVSTGK